MDLQENEQKAMDKKKGRALRDTLCSEVEEAVHAMQELSLQAKFTFSYDNDGNCNLAKPGSDPIDISHSGGYSSSAYIAHGSFPTSWGWATAGDRFSDAASAKVLITKKIYDRLNAEDRVKLSNVTGNNEPSTEGLFNNTAPLTEREMSFDISRDKERNRYYALGLYAIGDRPRP